MCLTNPVTANCCQQEPFSNTREVVKLCTKYWLAMILLHRLQHRRFHQKISNNQNTKIHHLHFNSHFLPETGFSQITQFFFLHLFCNRTLEDTWHILTLFTAFPSPKQQRHKTSICFYFHDMKIENAEWSLVLLRWQEFAIRSVAVFFDMPPRWWCRWQICVGVKAQVVNWKQVDVPASRSFRLSWNALITHCMRRWGVH